MSNPQAASDSTASKSISLTFKHLWTLDNFSHLYNENCQWKWSVESERFTVPENEELAFSLTLMPKVKGSDDGEEYLGVALLVLKVPAMWEGKVTVAVRKCIIDEEGMILWGKVYAERELFATKGIFDFEYLNVKKLRHPSAGYLKGGTLRMLVEMTFDSPEAIFNSPGNAHIFSYTSIPRSVSSLSHRFTLSHLKWLNEDPTRQMPFCVESEYFAPERENVGMLRIGYYPKGNKGTDAENGLISIFNYNTDCLLLHYECFLLDAKGDKCIQHEATYRMPPNNGKFFYLPRRLLLPLLDSLPADELTINCHVTVLKREIPIHTATPSTTHIDLALFTFHYVSFTWTIERFLAKLHRHLIDSEPFSPLTDSRYKFSLNLYPSKETEMVTITLCFVSSASSSIEEGTVDWRLSVVDANADEWNVSYDTDICIPKPAESVPHQLIPHHTLRNFASLLLPEGKLTIKCELWIHEPRKELPPELRNPPQASDPVARLSSGDTYITFGPNATLTNTNIVANSIVTAGNVTQTLGSNAAEPTKPK